MYYDKTVIHIDNAVGNHYYFEPITITYHEQGVTQAMAVSRDNAMTLLFTLDDNTVTITINQMVPNPILFNDSWRMITATDTFDREGFTEVDVNSAIRTIKTRMLRDMAKLYDRFLRGQRRYDVQRCNN